MATINFATREISAKVVYFGPTGAGSTTNLEHLHSTWPGRRKGALHGFGLRETDERSWYFEYLTRGPFEGLQIAMKVYCLPGGITLLSHREEVMRDVDGLVLVADARPDRASENVRALLDLEQLLKTLDLDLSMLSVVIQVNHTDTEAARPIADVVFDLNPFGFPVFGSIARTGHGVHETHRAVVDGIRERLRNAVSGQVPALALSAVHDPTRVSEADVVRTHVASILERSAVQSELDEISVAERSNRELFEGPEIELPFQPRELVGSRPMEVRGAEIVGDRVRVDLAMEHMGGGTARLLTIWLLNRPTDLSTPVAPKSAPSVSPRSEVFGFIDDGAEGASIETLPDPATRDLPGVWYGILGVGSGVLIGLLSAYLAAAAS